MSLEKEEMPRLYPSRAVNLASSLTPCGLCLLQKGVLGWPAIPGVPSGSDTLPANSLLVPSVFLKDPVLFISVSLFPFTAHCYPCSNDIKTPTLHLNNLMR